MSDADKTGLSTDQQRIIEAVSRNPDLKRHAYKLVEYFKLVGDSPERARAYLLEITHNERQVVEQEIRYSHDLSGCNYLMLCFMAVEALEEGGLCYSPTLDGFILVDPDKMIGGVINVGDREMFYRTAWPNGELATAGYKPDIKKEFQAYPDTLSLMDIADVVFPGYRCIDARLDAELREQHGIPTSHD